MSPSDPRPGVPVMATPATATADRSRPGRVVDGDHVASSVAPAAGNPVAQSARPPRASVAWPSARSAWCSRREERNLTLLAVLAGRARPDRDRGALGHPAPW